MGSFLSKGQAKAYFSAFVGIMVTIAIVRYPEEAFEASVYGLRLWFDVVLPALLPFFAMAEILMGLGVVHFTGVLLEPFMRPVFRIPGVGAFAVAMGLASGYPIGAKITARLRRENLCDQVEAERLVSFANTADPLFIVGAVAVGMFGLPQLGATLALAHYVSVVVVGFLMRYYGQGRERPEAPRRENIFKRAFRELYRHRRADGRPFGQLFGDAVRDSFASMLFIGGCIMMFSVLIRVLTVAGVTQVIAEAFNLLLMPFDLSTHLGSALASGFFEITIGTEAVSRVTAPLLQKAIVASSIIAWSGCSVHTQVASMLHGTDIRLFPYIMARLLHGVLAGITTLFLMGPGQQVMKITMPVFAGMFPLSPRIPFSVRLLSATGLFLKVMGSLLLIGVVIGLWERTRMVRIRFR